MGGSRGQAERLEGATQFTLEVFTMRVQWVDTFRRPARCGGPGVSQDGLEDLLAKDQ